MTEQVEYDSNWVESITEEWYDRNPRPPTSEQQPTSSRHDASDRAVASSMGGGSHAGIVPGRKSHARGSNQYESPNEIDVDEEDDEDDEDEEEAEDEEEEEEESAWGPPPAEGGHSAGAPGG